MFMVWVTVLIKHFICKHGLQILNQIEIRARQEGRAEENAKVFRENVRRMFSQGFSCEIIAKALGSTIEEVNDVLSDTSEDSFEDAKLFK